MKVLFACHQLPCPPNSGSKIRAFHMLRHIARRHSVALVTLAHTESELYEGKELLDCCHQVIVEVLPARSRWRRAAMAFPSRRSSSMAYFWSSRFYERVRKAARQTSFDVVIAHCAFAAQYVVDVPATIHLLDFCDIDSAKWSDYGRHRSFPLSAGYRMEARRLRTVEKVLASRFDCCAVATSGELEQFRALDVRTPCLVLPNGVDLSYFRREHPEPADSCVIAFVGRMNYFPNVQGIVKFVREAFPLVRQSVPAAELRIIGANPARSVRELTKQPGITVTGEVSDVRPHLRDAAVAIAPLYVARGTQNKILEAMAAGIPVVTTPLAARGVEAVPGRDLLLAENGAEFASQVVSLLQNPDLRREIAQAALRQAATAHSWSTTLQRLDEVLDGKVIQVRAWPCPSALPGAGAR